MKVYTIIVTFNAMPWIDWCLASLRNSSVQTTVVIVDNCSTDGTREYIPSTYPEVVWLPQKQNIGFGQGNNLGIRMALENGADYVLLLNQDASVEKDAIQLMLGASDGESLVTPLMLNGKGEKIDVLFGYSLKQISVGLLESMMVKNVLPNKMLIGETCAACWLLPINVVKKIGGFNPLFFQYGEDNNYYQRIKFHGIKNIFVPHAKIYHDRLLYGNVKAFNTKRLRRDMILASCDINRNLLKCLMVELSLLLRCYVYELPKRQYTPGVFARETIWMLLHSMAIMKSRHKEKKIGTCWLY